MCSMKTALALTIFNTYPRKGENKPLPVAPSQGFDPLQREGLMTCLTEKEDAIALSFHTCGAANHFQLCYD